MSVAIFAGLLMWVMILVIIGVVFVIQRKGTKGSTQSTNTSSGSGSNTSLPLTTTSSTSTNTSTNNGTNKGTNKGTPKGTNKSTDTDDTNKQGRAASTDGDRGNGEWRYATASYFNISDPKQNHNYIGCTSCSGCGFNDDSWLIALTKFTHQPEYCGKQVRLERVDNNQGVTVPILDIMMADDRKPNDIDMNVGVARALGFNPIDPGFGPNKQIRWRFI